ncbi:hypothetical protein EDD22DRAFT_961163 [Suillus occidentalis]|nr:hypothetical protein EDD22DRAFT_961163 [Suillus occidentalis]
MPVVRLPRPRHSARLKGVQTLSRKGARTMEPTQGPITRGRGGKNRGGRGSGTSNPDTASGRLVIQWQADATRTQRVVEHLHSHPADCRMLFHSDGKQANTEGDRPSGKDKLLVCVVIARHVFERDAEYAVQFQSVPDNFRDSTNNHINSLRKKYHECHDKLHATGAGVIPQDNTSAQNLHAQILEEFPCLEWTTLPTTFESRAWQEVHTHRARNPYAPAPPTPQYTPTPHSPHYPAPQPHPTPSGATYGGAGYSAGTEHPQFNYSAGAQRPYHQQFSTDHPQHRTHTNVPPTQPHGAPHSLDDDSDLPDTLSPYLQDNNLFCDDDDAMDMDQPPRHNRSARQDEWDHDPDVTNLNSPPRPRAHPKRPLPLPSPSPPPLPEFVPPPRSQTSRYDSRASFATPISRKHVSLRNSGGSSSSSWSAPASTTSAPLSTSKTSQRAPSSSNSKGKGRQVKKQHSDLQSQAQSQMEALTDGIESVQSDRVAQEHRFLREERAYERTEANVIHQRAQELKDSEIRLREAETKMHDALAHAHAEEAATLRLKIEFARLSQGS